MASLKEIAREYAFDLTYSPNFLPDSSEFESERVVAVWKEWRSWHAETIEFFQSDAAYEIEHVLNRAANIVALDKHAVAFGSGAAFDLFSEDDSLTKIAAIIAETYALRDPECSLREWQFSMRNCMREIEQRERWQTCEREMTKETNSEPDDVQAAENPMETASEEITEKTSEISLEKSTKEKTAEKIAKISLEESEKQADSEPDAVCVTGKTAERYREIRKISARSLYQLCEQNDWHTLGGDCDYERLLYALTENKENLSATDIIRIAENIVGYSRLELSLAVERVASEVARIADVFFEKVCDETSDRAPP